MEDAVPREISKEIKPTENTGISQAILADPAGSTEVPEQLRLQNSLQTYPSQY